METLSLRSFLTSYPFRLGLYGLLVVGAYQLIYLGTVAWGPARMGAENGPIESAQAVLAVIASIMLFIAAAKTKIGRAGLICCGAVVGYAAARECDVLFETLFFDDAYKYLVGLPLAVIAAIAIAVNRKTFLPETMWLARQPAATLFIVAGIFLIGVCQTLDRPAMWQEVSDPMQAAVVKGMIEEYAELFAYIVLALSSIEAVILATSAKTEPVALRPFDGREADDQPDNRSLAA